MHETTSCIPGSSTLRLNNIFCLQENSCKLLYYLFLDIFLHESTVFYGLDWRAWSKILCPMLVPGITWAIIVISWWWGLVTMRLQKLLPFLVDHCLFRWLICSFHANLANLITKQHLQKQNNTKNSRIPFYLMVFLAGLPTQQNPFLHQLF